MKVALCDKTVVMDYANRLRAAGATVKHDQGAGTVIAHEGAVCVYRAVEKGLGGPWVVMARNGQRIKWGS